MTPASGQTHHLEKSAKHYVQQFSLTYWAWRNFKPGQDCQVLSTDSVDNSVHNS